METEAETATATVRKNPVALFMAFGTKGDVYPIAAIAAAFACDQKQYHVFLVTHSAHENFSSYLEDRHVTLLTIKSPPALSIHENHDSAGSQELDFSRQKKIIKSEHRRECFSVVEGIFGDGPSMEVENMLGYVVVDGNINLLKKRLLCILVQEGWSFAELFRVRCAVAAPYVVPYSAPSTFDSHFRKELPLLYKYLQEAPPSKVCWKDVSHWMWPLFTENWGSWRTDDLNLSSCPFTDPVTGLPTWHDWPPTPLLLYGFSKEIVECPDYWPSNVRVCGFWFLPIEWQFSCTKCGEVSVRAEDEMCSAHFKLQYFLKTPASVPPVFVGLSSVGSMGFLRNAQAFLEVIRTVLEITNYRLILFTAAYEPLDEAVQVIAMETSHLNKRQYSEEGICLFDGRLFCFSGMIPYKWLFPRCAAAIHHGGSGTTAAALHAGIPQVICPFMLDQFYWAEKMHWIGVAPEPLNRNHLAPDNCDDMSIRIAANVLSRAIDDALSPKVTKHALEIAERISLEDGVTEAVRILKQEMMSCSS